MAYTQHAHPVWSRLIRTLLRSVLLQSILLALSQAQITLDGSLGPRGPFVGPNYRIGAELGQIRGSNLFHSFGQFIVRTGESATFTGPNTIANILGRVTGGSHPPSTACSGRRSPGPICFCSIPVGSCLGPTPAWRSVGRFT
jgi:hypothetical protein